jgi:biotin synthase-like enzyme
VGSREILEEARSTSQEREGQWEVASAGRGTCTLLVQQRIRAVEAVSGTGQMIFFLGLGTGVKQQVEDQTDRRGGLEVTGVIGGGTW